MAISHTTSADGTFSSAGSSAWNASHTIDAGTITTTELGGDITTAGKALLDDASAAAQRTTLGVTATGADTTYAFRANNLSDLGNAGTARTNLGLGTIATQAANSVAITGGSITGTTGVGYTLMVGTNLHNPTASQTIFGGVPASPNSTTANVFAVPAPIAGTITDIYWEIAVGGTLGSAQTGTVSVLQNNTTNTVVSSSATFTAARQQFSATGLSVSVAAGDRFQAKIINAAWSPTSPTNVFHTATIFIRT